jgi:hypothetical protein
VTTGVIQGRDPQTLAALLDAVTARHPTAEAVSCGPRPA